MERFGQALERARTSKGRSLASIAEETRIARRYLQALEKSDLDTLPGGAFDTGYIRSYADALGLDPEPFLASYHAERERLGRGAAETEAQLMENLSRLVARRHASPFDERMAKRAALAATGLVLVLTSAWLVTKRGTTAATATATATARDEPELAIESAADRAPTPTSTPTSTTSSTPPEEEPSAAAITVAEAGVGSDVVERNLVGAGTRFAEGSSVVFWTRVVGARPGAVIRHVWRYGGKIVMRSDLRIGGPHWRTYSRLVLPDGSSGGWEVEARDAEGNVIAQERFVCHAPAPDRTSAPR